eukprot:TRINITY_DN6723_c0_g1_i1.p2 TRINITY_DN6723_c0_g1~~TRINITY_DN6723_c0_g1_i1.p2  ORF type:complete len:122 (-),score=14.64 TRINITY_DN6723_c0_g1_i1:43-408(-)
MPTNRPRTITGIPGPRYANAHQFEQSTLRHSDHVRRLANDYPDPEGADALRWPLGLHQSTKGPRARDREHWIPEQEVIQKLQHDRSSRKGGDFLLGPYDSCLLYTSPSPRDRTRSRMPSSA